MNTKLGFLNFCDDTAIILIAEFRNCAKKSNWPEKSPLKMLACIKGSYCLKIYNVETGINVL